MRPRDIAQALNVCIDKQRPVMIWGPPGVGKSDTAAQVAAARGAELRDVRLNLMDPTDIKGFPVPDVQAGHMAWLPANFLPPMRVEAEILQDATGRRVIETDDVLKYEDGTAYKSKVKPKATRRLIPNESKGILFLDEINQAPPSVQAASYQLLLNRQIGDYKLPDGWAMMAAGNRESDRANAQHMPSALSLRLVHLDYEINVDDWCDWALNQGDRVPVELLSFIRLRPDLLHSFESKQRVSPNPRSWVFCGELTNTGLPPSIEYDLFRGTVGDGAATEYVAHCRIFRDLPTVDQITLDPDGTPVSSSPAVRFAITAALAHGVTKDVFPRFMQYVKRMEPEWVIAFVRDAQRRNREITETKEYTRFAIDNSAYLA